MSDKLKKTPLISSIRNPIVRDLAVLRQPKKRRLSRLSLIEGFQILRLALQSGNYPRTILYAPQAMKPSEQKLLQKALTHGVSLLPVTERVMAYLSPREGPLGCIASVPIRYTDLKDLKVSGNGLILLAEGIEKPGNIGVLIRTANAAAVQGVILADTQTDAFAPGSINASLGAIFAMPIVNTTAQKALSWLQKNKIQIVAATPSARKCYFEIDLTKTTCVAVGNEHRGLSPAWLKNGVPVRIPMNGSMNSLNATSAGAIILFDAVRQRSLTRFTRSLSQHLPRRGG